MFRKHNHGEGNERRGPRFIGRAVLGIIAAVAFALIFGIFVMLLWNWLMPAIFGLGKIAYMQGIGLVLLARLLFGRMGRHRDHAGYLAGRYGFRHFPWRGCGCAKEDAANGDIEDWRQYDAWWNAEGREAFKKYIGTQGSGKAGSPS